MAAPSGIKWGAIAGGYGRIGIYYTSADHTLTSITVRVEVWFWSKYSVSDSSNTLYYNNTSALINSATSSQGSMSVSTSVASGDGWSTSNQVLLKSFTHTYTLGTATVTRYLAARLINIDRVGAAMTVFDTVTVPKLPSYTVAYNANGGSGAPSSQTKWHGTALTLSSTKPTRTGYTFQGWATSASGSVAYASGASYTANAAVTLYAVWKAKTYTVSYNANGGSSAPSSQTKTYGVALTISTATPTRTNYTFRGWGTSATATTVAYAPGASYTANTAVTLYAIWELAYVKPIIHSLVAARCDASGVAADEGACGKITFEWECFNNVSSITIAWASSAGTGSKTVTASGKSGSVSEIIGDNALSVDASYTVTVTVTDSGGSNNATTTLNGAAFTMDFLAGGRGVAFGKPAEHEGVADFGLEAKFNKPVFGKALGLDKLPEIPTGSDVNNYIDTGCWAVYRNEDAKTIANLPLVRTENGQLYGCAGRLVVTAATGEGIRSKEWSYIRQQFIPYSLSFPVCERDISRDTSNAWSFGDWRKTSLTPTASAKVYDKAAATIRLSENVTLGVKEVYTKIPFNQLVVSTSDRLTLQNNSIRIGANISFVKVSGQILIKCGSATGNRHAKIQKVSGSTTTAYAWDCIYGVATSNTVFPFTPIIVPVKEGDLLQATYYTGDVADMTACGNSGGGWQTYLTVEEL